MDTMMITKPETGIAEMDITVIRSEICDVEEKLPKRSCALIEINNEAMAAARVFSCASIQAKSDDKKGKKEITKVKQEMISNSYFACELKVVNDRPYAPVVMQEQWVIHALLDSGSEATLISQEVYDVLNSEKDDKDKMKITKPSGILRNFNGAEVPIVGLSELNISFGKYRMTQPVTIVDIPGAGVIIGGDCLIRLSPLIDYLNNILWAQVKRPIPIDKLNKVRPGQATHLVERRSNAWEVHLRNSQVPEMTEIGIDTTDAEIRKGPGHVVIKLSEGKKWLTALEDNCLRFYYNVGERNRQETSVIEEIVQRGEDHFVPVTVCGASTMVLAKLLLTHERSFISEELYIELLEEAKMPFYQIDGKSITGHDKIDCTSEIIGRTMIPIKIGNKEIDHNVLIIKGAEHQVYLANDILNRYHAFIDLLNHKFWSRCGGNPKAFWDNAQAFQANQMTPYTVEVVTDRETEIPANTRQVTLHLRIKTGQIMHEGNEATVIINDDICQSGLTTQYVPIVTTNQNKCKILIDNLTSNPITIQKDMTVAMAIDDRHYSDDLTNTIIGRIPGLGPQEDGSILNETVSYPRGTFRIRSIHPYDNDPDTEVNYVIESDFIVFKIKHYE